MEWWWGVFSLVGVVIDNQVLGSARDGIVVLEQTQVPPSLRQHLRNAGTEWQSLCHGNAVQNLSHPTASNTSNRRAELEIAARHQTTSCLSLREGLGVLSLSRDKEKLYHHKHTSDLSSALCPCACEKASR